MSRRVRIAAALLLPAALLLAWGNHFRNGFHFDDAHTIVNNAFIRDLGNVPRFFRDAATFSAQPRNQAYRPLVTTSLAVDYRLARGLDPFFFHLSTFAVFLAQGALMFLLFRRALSRACPPAEAEGAALFAVAWYLVHPANAETINYVIARGDSLSTFFVVAAVVLYAAPAARRRGAYLLPAALGVLAKAVAAAFAPLLFAFELLLGTDDGDPAPGTRRAGRWRTAALRTAPAFLAAALLLALVRAMTPGTWAPGGSSRLGYALAQPLAILHYLATFFLPLRLSVDADWQPLASAADPRFLSGAAGLLALVGLACAAARNASWRPVSFGLWWFLIALVPTSFIFPLAEVVNDHRVFFPYVGLALAVAGTAALLLRRLRAAVPSPWIGRALFAGALLIVGASAYGTHRRNEVWGSDEALWRDATEKSPRNGRAWLNYGVMLMGRREYAGAEAAFARAAALVPNSLPLMLYRGALLASTGRTAEAEAAFRQGLARGGSLPGPHFFYARFLVSQKREREAIPLLRRALALAPADLDSRHELIRILERDPDRTELEALARETLRIAPGDPVALAALSGAGR